MKWRGSEPRSWDKDSSRFVRVFMDWATMRDIRYVYLITGGFLTVFYWGLWFLR